MLGGDGWGGLHVLELMFIRLGLLKPGIVCSALLHTVDEN